MKVRLTRLAVLIVFLTVATAGCGRYSIGNIRSLKAFQDANVLYKKGEYKAAVARYEDSIKFNPELGFAYFFLGNSYDNLYKPAKKGDPENDAYLQKAAEHYRTAIQKLSTSTDPKELEIRKLAFEYLIAAYGDDKLDDFSKAEPIAKELISVEPNEPSNYQALGRLYEDQGMFEEAEAQFLKAISLKPADALGYQVIAGFYNRQGEFEKTMDAWQKRAEAEPTNPEAWHTIGVYYQDKVFRDKKLPRQQALDYTLKGIEAEDKALSLNPEYFEALTYKNILLRQEALYEKDPAKQKELIRRADALRDQAMDIQKKQNAGTASGTPEKGGGS
jgi:tetratricopeptide (TPR) repeat protein